MAFQKITGTITLDNQVSGSHNLLGLRIDLLLPSSRNPEEGTWIGSSRIDETGFFEVMYVADQMLTTTITYQIYNGVYLIEKGTRPLSGALQISVKQEVYDHSIPDDTRKKVHIDYAVIQGSILLASGVPAVPVEESEVIVTIKKLKFRDAIVLTGTSIDRFGRYEIKLPYSALYPKAQFEYNSVPQVIIEIEADETVIASSQPVTLSENYITADIVIPDPDDYIHFISEYETILSHIHDITGLSDSEMATITTEGEQPEINTVVTTSGIDFESVNNIIMSSEIAADTGAEMHHLYAIIRAGNNNLGAISSIEPSVIQEIIENGMEGHIIPSSGNIQTTIELLNNYKIKTELKDTNDDDTSLEIILESILGNGTLANEFMAIHERMQLLSVEELWTEVETEMGSIHSQKLQQGFQMIAVVGLQAEMIQSLFSLQTPFPDYIAQSDTATIQSLVQQICVTHQKLCVPRSIRGHVPVQDYNNTAVHEAYAKKITAIGKEIFASGVIIEALANDQQFSAQFTDPLNVSQFLSQNREFDFRVTNIWETSLKHYRSVENGYDAPAEPYPAYIGKSRPGSITHEKWYQNIPSGGRAFGNPIQRHPGPGSL
ncbi:MAG: hypothetical protein KL787_09020 [Taibaiella sp.]|nr:hypothetical protein [Taibaiella sp.]